MDMVRIITTLILMNGLLFLPVILTIQLTLIILPAFLNWFLPENSSLRPKASTLSNDSAVYLQSFSVFPCEEPDGEKLLAF